MDIIARKLVPKVISAPTHSAIDYVQAGVSFVAAVLLWNKNRKAAAAALALGTGVLANALATDYPGGIFRLYGFKVHGVLDYGLAAVTGFMPELLGINQTSEAKYFRLQASAETAIITMTNYNDPAGANQPHEDKGLSLKLLEKVML
jgi:hypothetical protein